MLKYVQMQLECGNYTILPESIAVGTVYRIRYCGNLEEDGYECGFLYISRDSGIKDHVHINNIEQYRLVKGILSVYGKEIEINECFIGDSHNIDIVSCDTVVQTLKVDKTLGKMLVKR